MFRSIENGVENILYEPALDKASEGKRSNENQQTAIPKAVFFFRKTAMQVFINGKPTRLEKSLTLEQLLKSLNINQEHSFAVALNAEVIAQTKLANIYVKDGDTLEIIRATAGG